jgi:hypothetical protein
MLSTMAGVAATETTYDGFNVTSNVKRTVVTVSNTDVTPIAGTDVDGVLT